MSRYTKLYVFDLSSNEDVDQARVRFEKDSHVYHLGVSSRDELLFRMDTLKAGGYRFNRVLFQTHGQPGAIKLNGVPLLDTTMKYFFGTNNYHTLFPGFTKFYFDGCDVGAGPKGDQFMLEVGRAFLKLGGGIVMAWTSTGYAPTGGIWSFLQGHTIHPTGHLKQMTFDQGGVAVAFED